MQSKQPVSEADVPEADVPVLEVAEEVIEVAPVATPRKGPPSLVGPTILVSAVVMACSLYANLSCLVVDRNDYRFFPPFERGVNQNWNTHLGAEYFSIANALAAGRGFSDPFKDETGPTAWMPPMLSWLEAGLIWVAEGDVEIVTALVVLLQDLTLIATGILLLALSRRTTGGVWLAALLFVAAMIYSFRHCFQFTHDCWIILLVVDVIIAGMVWLRPLESTKRRAAAWGIVGGLCALTGPIAGFTWGILALASGLQRGRRSRLVIAALMSILTITPWIVRNYLLFGKFIPVKSNLAFELYQSQCLTKTGVLRGGIFATHPYASDGEERWTYRKMGEIPYIDSKMELFKKSVEADPMDFAERVANRFFAATLEYIPFEQHDASRYPVRTWISRIVFPLPFLALLGLVVATPWRPLSSIQWVVIGVYLSYLLPYVVVSYYDRYKFPLIMAETALVVWALARVVGWFRTPVEDDEVIVVAEED